MRYEIRPLGPWIDPPAPDRAGSHRFKANWPSTLDLLERETSWLGADLVIVQVDVREGEIRRDGMLAARAKVGFPGVRVSFESLYGPLTYATDAYEQQLSWAMPSWQANVRAIALALEALRAVDRYGVTRRGEQYQGWTQLAAKPAEMTVGQAAEFLAHWAGDGHTAAAILADGDAMVRAYRAAAKRTHPDVTSDLDTFKRINLARDLLIREGGRTR